MIAAFILGYIAICCFLAAQMFTVAPSNPAHPKLGRNYFSDDRPKGPWAYFADQIKPRQFNSIR